jgi:hypothetical protein
MRNPYYGDDTLKKMSADDCAAQLHAVIAIHFGTSHADAILDLIEAYIEKRIRDLVKIPKGEV